MTPKRILTFNGYFLIIVGILQVTGTLLGRFAGIGLFAPLSEQPLGTLGFFEAFSLAFIFGIILLHVAKTQENLKFWNFLAAGVHLTLGTANIIFWTDLFVAIGAEIPGTVATVVHFGFVAVESLVGLKTRAENE